LIDLLQVLRVVGFIVAALLGGVAMAVGFVVLIGQARFMWWKWTQRGRR